MIFAGLPAENDWVLKGPLSDKSLMRDVLAYELAAETNQYAPRSKFAELYLDGCYEGVYVPTPGNICRNRIHQSVCIWVCFPCICSPE